MQPGFPQRAYGRFSKNEEHIQKITETRDSGYIHQNELDKSCFLDGMIYQEEQLLIKYYAIKSQKLKKLLSNMDIKEDFLQWFTIFFD